MREYKPACGVDGKVYFSPCHAGCAEEHLFKPDEEEVNHSYLNTVDVPIKMQSKTLI